MNYLKQIFCTFFWVLLLTPSFAQTSDSTAITPHSSPLIPNVSSLTSDTSNLKSQISNPKSQISNLTSDTSNLKSQIYSSVHYRGNATLNINEQIQECQFTIISVIDSFLYIQLNFGPIEVGRALATPNHIVFINKLQKKYYNGDYSFIEKIINTTIDFYTLQGIFNGSLAEPPEEFELSYQRDSLSYEYPFFNALLCEYYTLSLQLDVKKATFNAAPSVSATIPKNYTEIGN